MTDIADRLNAIKADEAEVDARIRDAVERSGTRPPLRRPEDVQRDRRMPQGRIR